MAVFAPMPSASALTATIVKPGLRHSRRTPCLRSWRSVVSTSFAPEGDDGIYSCRAACGREGRGSGDGEHDGRYTREGRRIRGADAEQLARQKTGQRERAA